MRDFKREDAISAIALYDAIVERCVSILGGPPYWTSIFDAEYARISIKDDKATITWPEADSGWEQCYIDRKECSIPLGLLFISDEEFAVWQVEQRAIYDRQEQDRLAAAARDREAIERAALAALKAKYEG